jgi:hypothetical protein
MNSMRASAGFRSGTPEFGEAQGGAAGDYHLHFTSDIGSLPAVDQQA